MRLSIIIVNYHSEHFLIKCLASIEKALETRRDFEVIVVNNDSNALTLDRNFSFPLTILQSKHNHGFGSANNLGAKEAKGDNLLLLNPDTLLDSSIIKLFDFFENNTHLGIVGPKIIQTSRGEAQPFTCGKKTSLFSILFRNTILKPWNSKNTRLVDWVSGTALLIRKPLFEKLTGFDQNFFMYFEDQDLCLRAKELGYDIAFFPQSKIFHFDGKCWPNTKKQKLAFYQAQDYFFTKHHNFYQNFFLKFLKRLVL